MKRLIGLMLVGALSSFGAESSRPNVVVIYADDLGYGDLGCYGADTNMVQTPNIDSLATHGRRFTDAHSASAVCTPSRYALLTGEYPFRENLYAPIFLKDTLIIPEDTTTVADVMKNAGYATGIIGKWHMGFQDTYPIDWNAELKPGPLELGFDYYYGVPTVNSHPPFVYVENHHVVGHVYDANSPDYEPFDYNLGAGDQGYTAEVFEKMKINDIGGSQAAHALYNDYEVGLHLAGQAVDWIDANKDDPFFLILTATQVHHPFTPAPQFQGTSGCGLYGDFIHELDYIVGLLLQKLEDEGLTENTLVIFTSDNGAMANVTGQEAWHAGHHMNGPLLGFKSDGWEGGHRVPFIAKWPGHIPTNTVSDQLIGQVDFLATMAELTETEISEDVSPDGVNILPALVGETDDQIRDHLVCAPYKSTFLVLRQGDWAYLSGQGSAGWNNYEGNHTCSGPKSLPMTGDTNDNYLVTGSTVALVAGAPATQLYNLANDLSQTTNVVEDETVKADEMAELLATLKAAPISTNPVVVVTGAVNVAEAYIDENTVPDGWQYLFASEAIGGTETAMPLNVTFETGRTGFGFTGFPKLLGHVTGGVSFTINPANTANAAVEGSDLLIAMGNTADNDHVIIQYTIQAEDVASGTNAWIMGSFRDLSGKTTGNSANSIVGSVYHNSTLLFSATGANGKLSQANGTFDLSGISIEAGDTIRFVIGNNGSYEGDETALTGAISIGSEEPMEPVIDLNKNSLGFGRLVPGNTNSLTLTIKNVGGGLLDGTASIAAPFYIESGAAYSLSNNQEQVITVQFIPQAVGDFNETLSFTGGDGASIPVSGTGAIPGSNDPITMDSLLNQMNDRSEHARFPDPSFRLINFSSYNRDSNVGPPASGVSNDDEGWFKNNDYNGIYLYTTTEYGHGTEYVMVDHQAPGALVRFWTPWRATGTSTVDDYVRIYLDGSTTPVIEGNMLTLFDGTGLIPYPFGHPSLRSAVSFFPITYAERCVVTLDRSPFFYIYTCREYDPGTQVESFTMADFTAAGALISSTGASLLDPAASVPAGTVTSTTTSIAAGDEAILNLPAGGNAVHEFTVEVISPITPQLLRSLIVKAEFDGMDTIWCPLSDFFGSGVGLHPFEGWYRTVEADGTFSCRWVMPYQADGRLSLENLSGSSVDVAMSAITEPWTWDDRSMYFHSAWRSQYPLPTRPYSDWNYVTLSGGRGVYIGDTLTIWNPATIWWGEGDHKIWVDDDTFPSMFGTGTEDYYAYSWGGRSTDFYEHPFHAQVQCNVYDKLNRNPNPPGDDKNTYGYSVETRSRALDGIVFQNYLQLDMEVWTKNVVDMDYAVASHWYADVDTVDNRSPDLVSVMQTVWDETSANPALYVSVPEVDFGFTENGEVTSVTITVQNRGGGTLSGTASTAAPFSIVSGGSYSLGTADSQEIVLRFAPTAIGAQTGLLTLTGGNGAHVVLEGCGYIDVTTGSEDSDGDDLPDLWESKWVSNLTDLHGDGDFDEDGSSDGHEYNSGSNPLDKNDFFVISDFMQTVNGPRVTWTTEPGKSYTIERATGLTSNSWITVATGLSSGVWIDTSPEAQDQAQVYYRVRTD